MLKAIPVQLVPKTYWPIGQDWQASGDLQLSHPVGQAFFRELIITIFTQITFTSSKRGICARSWTDCLETSWIC